MDRHGRHDVDSQRQRIRNALIVMMGRHCYADGHHNNKGHRAQDEDVETLAFLDHHHPLSFGITL